MSLGPQIHALMQPVRPAVICRHLGQLALVLALLIAVPTGFAALSGDKVLAVRLLLAALLPALADVGLRNGVPSSRESRRMASKARWGICMVESV